MNKFALILIAVGGVFINGNSFAQDSKAAAAAPAAAQTSSASPVSPAVPAAPPAPAPATAAARSPKAAPARPTPDSLMFTSDEINEVQSRTAGSSDSEGGGSTQPIEDATLYLSTILYMGPKDWTIWINGVPIDPKQDFQAFQVTQIDSNSVELLVPLSAQGMRPVRLQPNQTFVSKTGAVVEGRYP